MRRRVDPEGAALAVAVAGAVEELSWPQVAWLAERGGAGATFELGGSIRTINVVTGWDQEPWASGTSNAVSVTGVARGTVKEWSHTQTAHHASESLPAGASEPEAFDFEALVRRATVAPELRKPPARRY